MTSPSHLTLYHGKVIFRKWSPRDGLIAGKPLRKLVDFGHFGSSQKKYLAICWLDWMDWIADTSEAHLRSAGTHIQTANMCHSMHGAGKMGPISSSQIPLRRSYTFKEHLRLYFNPCSLTVCAFGAISVRWIQSGLCGTIVDFALTIHGTALALISSSSTSFSSSESPAAPEKQLIWIFSPKGATY